MSGQHDALVTILISPRERFSIAQESLESIYENTAPPFRLVYVDGGSPPALARCLVEAARRYGFELIRTPHFLSPNQARNIGLRAVGTRYVVFIDNDVIVAPGWLPPLIDCAQETDAAVVGPLVCQGRPLHTTAHFAGGECGVIEKAPKGVPERHLYVRLHGQGVPVAKVLAEMGRRHTELAEFHCMLARTEAIRRLGPLDEGLLSTRENVDLCMLLAQAGEAIWIEPRSVITYLDDAPIRLQDVHYYMLRWCDAWERASLLHLKRKWNLTADDMGDYRLRYTGLRRRHRLIQPVAERLSLGLGKLPRRAIEETLVLLDRSLNVAVHAIHRRAAART